MYNPDGVMAHHVWLVEMGRGGACVPARVALQGRICPNHNDTHTFLFKRMRGRECVLHSRSRRVWGEARRWREGWCRGGLFVAATSPMNAGRYMRLRCDWPAPVPLYRLLVVLKR